jgi:hypothetical protein
VGGGIRFGLLGGLMRGDLVGSDWIERAGERVIHVEENLWWVGGLVWDEMETMLHKRMYCMYVPSCYKPSRRASTHKKRFYDWVRSVKRKTNAFV